MSKLDEKTINKGFKLLGLDSENNFVKHTQLSELEKLVILEEENLEWTDTINNTEIKKENAKLESNP